MCVDCDLVCIEHCPDRRQCSVYCNPVVAIVGLNEVSVCVDCDLVCIEHCPDRRQCSVYCNPVVAIVGLNEVSVCVDCDLVCIEHCPDRRQCSVYCNPVVAIVGHVVSDLLLVCVLLGGMYVVGLWLVCCMYLSIVQ